MRSIAAFLCFFTCTLWAHEDKPIQVSGVLSLEVFPGRPNYESIKGGDEPEKAWILTVMGEKKEKFQLVVADGSAQKFAMLRRCAGKKISVDGVVWEADNGHHHTPFLISIHSITEEPNQSSQPTPPSRRG
jgi:hypothetical protein